MKYYDFILFINETNNKNNDNWSVTQITSDVVQYQSEDYTFMYPIILEFEVSFLINPYECYSAVHTIN